MKAERKVVILNRLGLHARPASRFAQTASNFQADVWVEKDGISVDGKSILEVLTVSCPTGSEIVIRAEGPDAQEAVEKLASLVASRFGEID
ncbi:MAG: HPr family phosphocarrier protein [Thermodesulfobacteria bacterium]|nr:HPr family phosphocarrier protein [Thermodesulfobacteriota bacterium]